MRRILFAMAALLVAALLVPVRFAWAEPPDEEDGGPAAPFEAGYVQKTIPGQELPRHAYDDAAAQADKLPAVGGSWNLVGPSNIGGRIVDLAVDPRKRDALYVATASGGLWRSTDAGATFAPAWPENLTQALGSVAVAPDGTLYVGTGEANPGGGSITYTGTGLYKSTDGGRKWTNIGLRDSGAIGKVVIDPTDPRRIFVAATGSLFNQGGDRGVYRTLDGGRSWTRVLDGVDDTTGASEVMFDPKDPKRVFAVLWDHRRQPDKRSYSGPGSGVYRSTDGGDTWKRLDALVPAAADLGRIGIGIAPSDPHRMYAIIGRGTDATNEFGGFATSADGGDTWTALPDNPDLEESQSSYAWWFGKIWVDPRDAAHLHVAGVALMTSHDGGRTWTGDGETVHGDQHAMMWDPAQPARVYLGNDGGLYRSENDGDSGWVKATYEPFTQFYGVSTSPQDTTRFAGGAQDNGALRSWGPKGWDPYVDGDGEQTLINPSAKDNVFGCYQYGNCFRSTDGGTTTVDFTDKTTADRRNWFTPVQFDPTDPNVLYYGGNRLNRSTDNGVTWTPISPDLTGGPGRDIYPYGTITTVAAAKSDPRTLYVGTDDGRVWRTGDLGGTWTLVLSGQPWVTRVTVDPRRADTVYVTLSGYRAGSPQPHILMSRDGGRAWTDLSGNLPRAPVNDVVIGTGNILYIATDQGVFATLGGLDHWVRLGHLPLVPVTDLSYDASAHRLVAATFGRGMYQIKVP
ncbi:sialidase family protein [Actinokineospora enzanensis]|uniref:sialidase family protein n=1 Tax=Actinokineospora enzanensis TaxID=155975 RepID=UPI000369FC1C|nr:sialidase family protein [Actinokineospora enzanensis]